MRVSEIGEFGLIRLLAEQFGISYPPTRRGGLPSQPGLLVGLGDDAVVGRRREGALIWTTDTLVAGVHFLADRTAWGDVGWKALAVNLSDVAAMGGEPDLALVTLLLPDDFCVEDAVALYRGLKEAADVFGVSLGGGDIVRAPCFAVTVALSGWALSSRLGEPRVMTRGAARLGDRVAVSGALGAAAGGLRLLREGAAFKTKASRLLRAAHQRPQPRVALGRLAVASGVRCAIDVSDGLVQDLGHVAQASSVGIRVDAARVPTSAALRKTLASQALGLALSGGEDYELVLVASRPAIDSLIEASETPLTEIGEVVQYDSPRVAVVDESGREIPLAQGGWDHFAAR